MTLRLTTVVGAGMHVGQQVFVWSGTDVVDLFLDVLAQVVVGLRKQFVGVV